MVSETGSNSESRLKTATPEVVEPEVKVTPHMRPIRLDGDDRAILRLFMPPAEGEATSNQVEVFLEAGQPEEAEDLRRERRLASRPQKKAERVRSELNAARREGKSLRWVQRRLLVLTYRGLLETPGSPRRAWLGSSFRISEMGLKVMSPEKGK